MSVAAAATLPRRHAALEQAGLVAVCGVAGALQFSIAVAQILLTVAICCWVALLILVFCLVLFGVAPGIALGPVDTATLPLLIRLAVSR